MMGKCDLKLSSLLLVAMVMSGRSASVANGQAIVGDKNPTAQQFVCYSSQANQFQHGKLDTHSDLRQVRYYLASRWAGGQGTPTTITWSFVPDGLQISSGGFGDPAAPSVLFSTLDSKYAYQGGRSAWVNRFQQAFDRWEALSGISFTRVTDGVNDWDDGAGWTSSAGSMRGQIRIAMKPISSAILAFGYYPASGIGGNIVFDDSAGWGASLNEHRYLRNVAMHEIGHALGLMHMCSSGDIFLMEPGVSTIVDGPQHDDIRAAQRHYGDPFEPNDSVSSAVAMGGVQQAMPINTLCDVEQPVAGPNGDAMSNCSIDGNGDQDYYSFDIVNAQSLVNITVTPLGLSYDDSAQSPGGSCSSSSTTDSTLIANLDVSLIDGDGTTVLASASSTGPGGAESIDNISLNAGTYYIRVFESGNPTQTQLYTLTVDSCETGCQLTVPDDFATIQDAIDALPDAGTVIVRDGTYTGAGNMDILIDKDVTVRSESGSDNCVIQPAMGSRGFVVSTGATLAVIEGIAIEFANLTGLGLPGGAVEVLDGDVTIRDCRFTQCLANNGGAVFVDDSVVGTVIEGTVFDLNTSTMDGGAVYVDSGGVVTIRNCEFIGNGALVDGGAVKNRGNTSLVNSVLRSNGALAEGGGVHNSGAMSLASSTLVGNGAIIGGGVHCLQASTCSVSGTILWNNTVTSAGAQLAVTGAQSSPVSVDYCNVQGGASAVHDPGAIVTYATTNIDADPIFVDQANGNLHIVAASPCVDTGDRTMSSSSDTDIDGEARVNGVIDMGADEYHDQPLEADVYQLSNTAGGSVAFSIDFGPAYAGLAYMLVGSRTGTEPGTVMGNVVVPLNQDDYSLVPSTLFTAGTGLLDSQGRAGGVQVTIPGGVVPYAPGTLMHHAVIVIDAAGAVVTASNAEPLTILP